MLVHNEYMYNSKCKDWYKVLEQSNYNATKINSNANFAKLCIQTNIHLLSHIKVKKKKGGGSHLKKNWNMTWNNLILCKNFGANFFFTSTKILGKYAYM